MNRLFISHSSKDDGFVRELQKMLADHGQAGWIDSRELRGGDPLWPEIQAAIEAASAFAVVVSPEVLQSTWVGSELQHALKLRADRGKLAYPVIPLSLDGTRLGMAQTLFGEEPVYIPASSGAGGVEALMNALLLQRGSGSAALLAVRRVTAWVPDNPYPDPVIHLAVDHRVRETLKRNDRRPAAVGLPSPGWASTSLAIRLNSRRNLLATPPPASR